MSSSIIITLLFMILMQGLPDSYDYIDRYIKDGLSLKIINLQIHLYFIATQ